MKVSTFIRISLVLFLSFTSCNALANDAALFELLKALHANGTIDDRTYEAIRKVAVRGASTDEQVQKKEVKKAVAEAMKTRPKINTKGKFETGSPGGDFKVRIGGRVQTDAAFYNSDKTKLGSGTELRRARLYMKGTLWRGWNYKMQYDFTQTGSKGIADAYLEYAGWQPASFRLGHFKEPWSLEGMMSSNNLAFTERSLTVAFRPGRNIGVSAAGHGDGWTAALGLFGHGVGQVDAADPSVSEGFGVTGRATYTPIREAGQILHIGGSLSYRHADQNHRIRFSGRPESHITDVKLVDTGVIDADSFVLYDAEAAWVLGPFSLQGEYAGTEVNRHLTGNPDLSFNGYYVQGSWMLTGELRADTYDLKSGTFKGIKPNSIFGEGGIGAWQVAARFSSLDLNDADIRGGREHDVSLGLNWYATPTIRFMADYVKVLSVDGGAHNGDEPSSFLLRGQVVF